MKKLRSSLSYANVVATLALFLVLTGAAAYAGTKLARNSVGAAQLKRNAVTPAKLSHATKALVGARGPQGATGPQGTPGRDGAPGQDGAPGKNLTAETPLASGHTETGVFGQGGNGESSRLVGVAAFVQPLSAGIAEDHTFALAVEQTNAHCPGIGQAEAGYFCAYATKEVNAYLIGGPFDPAGSEDGAGKDGSVLIYAGDGTGVAYVYGSWAVTAP